MARRQTKSINKDHLSGVIKEAVHECLANELYSKNQFTSADYQTAYSRVVKNNPYLQEQRVKDQYTRPILTRERTDLEESIKNFTSKEKELRNIGNFLGTGNYSIFKIEKMYSDILTYNWFYQPQYVDEKTFTTNKAGETPSIVFEKYMREMRLVDKVCKNLDLKKNSRIIAQQISREGKVAYLTRIDVDKSNNKVNSSFMQMLPSDWWKIVGYNNKSHFTVMFDFMYFMQIGNSIYDFPDYMVDIYKSFFEIFQEDEAAIREKRNNPYSKSYITASKEDIEKQQVKLNKKYGDNTISLNPEYKNGQYYFWAQLPIDKCYVYAIDLSHPYHIPPFIGLFLTAQDLAWYEMVQKQRAKMPLDIMFTGEIPLLDQTKNSTANKATGLAITQSDIDYMYDTFDDILMSSGTTGKDFFAAPLKNIQAFRFENDPNGNTIVAENIKAFNSKAGLTAMIATDPKPNAGMVANSRKIESGFADILYPQIMTMVNNTLENLNLNFDWDFQMFGNRFDDENDRSECEKSLTIGLNGFLARYLALKNQTLLDYKSNSYLNKKMKIYENNELLESIFNAKETDGEKGRPEKPIEDVTDDDTMAAKDKGVGEE